MMKLQLKALRNARGLSQEDMAKALGEKTRTYGSWERGEVMMNLEQACRCAAVLKCTVDDIVREPERVEYYAIGLKREN